MIIDAHQLRWFYRVNYMINELLVDLSTGVLQAPGGSAQDLVYMMWLLGYLQDPFCQMESDW